jgi:hypothetical protein
MCIAVDREAITIQRSLQSEPAKLCGTLLKHSRKDLGKIWEGPAGAVCCLPFHRLRN